jgi:hypothetical protein
MHKETVMIKYAEMLIVVSFDGGTTGYVPLLYASCCTFSYNLEWKEVGQFH